MYTDAEKKIMPLMLIILLAITFLLWLLLRKKSKAWQSVPFIIITLALIAGEVGKQIASAKKGYDLWHLPVHFCSTYFIWFSLAEFTVGKVRQTMQNVAFVATLYLCFALYGSPSGIMPNVCDNIFKTYFTGHSFFFHHLVILYMLLSIAFKRFKPQKRDVWTWVICFASYFTVATICAYTFQENYFDILNSEPIPVFEPIRLAVGQFIYDAGILFVLLFFGSLILFVAACIREKCHGRRKIENEYPSLKLDTMEVTSRR